jgi:hypothetical protein
LLDSGWRVLNGQRPAIDFDSGIAPLTSAIMAAGMLLARESIRGIGYGVALVAGLAGLWAYLLTRGRIAWIPGVLSSLVLALLAAAPFPLGLPANRTSHAMVYNRFGYALLGVVMIDALLASGAESRRRSFWCGFSGGFLTVLLFFLKPSFGLVALVFLGLSAIRSWRSLLRPLGFALGLGFALLAIGVFLHFDFAAVWSEFRMLAGARSSSLSFWEFPWALTKNVPDMLGVLVLAAMVGAVRSYRENGWRALEPFAIAAVVLLGQAGLLATNAQPGGYPLIGALALVLMEQGRIAAEDDERRDRSGILRTSTAILLVGFLCFASTTVPDAGGFYYAMLEAAKGQPDSRVARFTEPHLTRLFLHNVPDGTLSDLRSNGNAYVEYVNTGVALIQSVSGAGETICTLDFTNPFSYALLRRPPHGGAASMDFGHQFNDTYKPAPERLFGDADIVMVPKRPSASDPTTEALRRNYLAGIQARYAVCAESDWWTLYKRPARLAGCPTLLPAR